MPKILKEHYAILPYSNDSIKLEGVMDIKLSTLTKSIKPLLKFFGALVPYEGKDIPTTVYVKSHPNKDNFVFERNFKISKNITYVSHSTFLKLAHKKVWFFFQNWSRLSLGSHPNMFLTFLLENF